jgi:uncharacterized protein (DUF302 family)
MDQIRYGYQKTLSDTTFEDALARVEEELKKEGFGVLTEIDVKNTLKQKLDVDFRRYKILGACNPNLAHQALGKESHIGLLMPCNVVVQETEDQKVIVSIADPKSMFAMVNNDEVGHLAEEADGKLRRVLEAV